MKKSLLMLIVMLSSVLSMSAENLSPNEQGGKKEKGLLESTNALVIGQHGVTLQVENTNLYNFYLTRNKRFYLLGGNVMRIGYSSRDERGLVVPFCVAGGMGYSLVNDIERKPDSSMKSRTTLDLQGLCKQTLFGCFNWKYTELDVTLKTYLDRVNKDDGLVFGVGYKYNKSHSSDVEDMNCWYITLGKSF